MPGKVLAGVGPIHERITGNRGGFLAILTDEQLAFAATLLDAATAANRADTERLRAVADDAPRER